MYISHMKIRQKHFFLLPFLLIFLSNISKAQVARNYSNEFLNIGVDAKSLAMGKAVTAISSDVNAIYWNPAGLTGVNNKSISLMHSSYFAGLANYDYLAYAQPIENENLFVAASLIRFGVDQIMNTTQLIDNNGQINFDRISFFSAADYALTLGVAKRFNQIPGLSAGLNLKIIHRAIGKFAQSWGAGFDLGIHYKKKIGTVSCLETLLLPIITGQDDSIYEDIQQTQGNIDEEAPENKEITLPKFR